MDSPSTTADPKVAAVVNDAISDVSIAKALIAAIKANGVAGAVAQAPAVIAAVEQDIADVTAAIPVIKAGYQTTEFWFGLLACALIASLAKFTSLPASSMVAVSSAIAALAAVYTVVRGMAKSTPAPVAAVKAPATAAK